MTENRQVALMAAVEFSKTTLRSSDDVIKIAETFLKFLEKEERPHRAGVG